MAGNPSVLFNNIPGSGLVAPLFAFEVNSGGGYSSSSRLLVMGHKNSAAPAIANMPIFVGSQSDADAAFGAGSMLREMFRIIRQNAPVQEIWMLPVAETGVAQVWTLALAAVTISAGVAVIDIHGERIQVTVAATDTATTLAAAVSAAINNYYNPLTGAMLPFTASASTTNVILTARHASALFAGEDPTYFPTRQDGFPSNLLTSANVTVTSTTAGTGVPSLTAAFAALADDQFDGIVMPWGDATSIASASAAMNDTSGRWSWLRQSYGHVITVNTGNASAQTTLGLTLNDRHLTVIGRAAMSQTGTPQPAWLWAAGFAARVMPWLSDYTTGNVARNQSNLAVQGLSPPRDRSLWWNYSTRNTFVQSGVSTWGADIYGNVLIDKLVTTSQKGTSGQPDPTFRDIQALFQIMHGLRYIRTALANQHGNKAFSASNPGNLAAISTPRDIKATIIGAAQDLTRMGILEKTDFTQIVVQADPLNPARAAVFMPLSRVKPLDVLAANATFYNAGIPQAA